MVHGSRRVRSISGGRLILSLALFGEFLICSIPPEFSFPKAGPRKDLRRATVLKISGCGGVGLAYCVGNRSGLPVSIQVLALFRIAVTAVALN